MNSYYKIMEDKIIFSDQRMDQYRYEILTVFRKFDIIQTFYTSPKTMEESMSVDFNKKIKMFDDFENKKEDCLHKAVAARYSLALIDQEISNKPTTLDMKNYSEMIANKMCSYAEIKNDVLIYEVESFLSQIRTNLDTLIQLLKYTPERDYLDFSGDKCKESFEFGQDLNKNSINKMRSNNDLEMADFFDKEINSWIRNLNELRNDIIHRSGLKGFSCFVFKSGTEKVIDPLMPNNIKVSEYCHYIFEKLLSLYDNVFGKFILSKFKK